MDDVVVGPSEARRRWSWGAMTSDRSAVQARGCWQRVGRSREGGRRREREARRAGRGGGGGGAREGEGGAQGGGGL